MYSFLLKQYQTKRYSGWFVKYNDFGKKVFKF